MSAAASQDADASGGAGPGLLSRLAAPVDGASLGLFRIGMGLVMGLEGWEILVDRQIDLVFTGDHVHWRVPYPGFEWLDPVSAPFLSAVVSLMVVASIALALGTVARAAAAVVALCWTYVWLLDATLFNNHYYLFSLLLLLLVFMPSDRCYRFHWGRAPADDAPRTVPFWCVFWLRAQLFVLYFFAGVAKTSVEWLQHAEPMRTALARDGVVERLALLPEPVFALTQGDAFAHLMSRTGLLFDLGVGFLLLLPRTRILGFALAAGFHVMNHGLLFADIGWFPLAGLLATTIFLAPDWSRRLAAHLRARRIPRLDARFAALGVAGLTALAILLAGRLDGLALLAAAAAAPAGVLLGWRDDASPLAASGPPLSRALAAVLALWLLVQFTLPLRHYAIPGAVNWTGEGSRFAWRMKSHAKSPGPLRLRVEDEAVARLAATPAAALARPDAEAFEAWPGPPAVYTETAIEAPGWESRPEWVVVFEPFVGERVLYNPGAPGAARDAATVAARWRSQFGGEAQVTPTLPTEALLDALAAAIAKAPTAAVLAPRVDQARDLLARRAALEPDDPLRIALTVRFRKRVRRMALDRGAGDAVRAVLLQAPPLWMRGAAEPAAPWFLVEDAVRLPRDARHFGRIEREGWRGSTEVLAVLSVDPTIQGAFLPRTYLWRRGDGALEAQWNPEEELHARQLLLLKQMPPMIHQYAWHVAEAWRERTGRWPAVYAETEAALRPWGAQPQIYPFVDLASRPLHHFSHNDWIVPLRRTPPGRADPAR